MQPQSATPSTSQSAAAQQPATRESVTLYHWLVVILAACGWLFDCMGQRIFVLGREPAMRELLGAAASDADVKWWGGIATCVLMIGWATGGILFGQMSDRFGRVKAMVTALLLFSIFSTVSGFARGPWDYLFYRLLFGLGVGGMFGAATTLVAESVPAHFRTVALGLLQALSACGNMLGSALSHKIRPGAENFWGHFSGWQVLFFVGLCPAILAAPMAWVLKEPEPWKRAKAQAATGGAAKAVGSIPDLFRHPRWRHNTFVGICLGLAGMVGLWGIAFFSPELIRTALKNRPLQVEEILKPNEICAALKSPANPAIAKLKMQMSLEVLRGVEQTQAGMEASASTVDALRKDLNRLIQDKILYDADSYKSVALKKSTRNLVEQIQKKGGEQGVTPDVVKVNRQLVEQLFPGAIGELEKTTDGMVSWGTFLQDFGALFGMFAFTVIASRRARRAAFLFGYLMCLVVVSGVFYSLKTTSDVYWMLPLMGFATLSVFAGYSIYFPELFPARLRGTGVGFCYNTVRYLAAPFPFLLGWLGGLFPFRTVAVTMCAIYLVGIIALLWAPETRGKPLPED